MNNPAPVVLITGASSGIGLALARKLIQTNMRVVLTARAPSLEKLFELGFKEHATLLIRSLDVCEEDNCRAVIQDVEHLWGGVDILVNNAGISYRSVLEHMTKVEEVRQMQTNYQGPLSLMRLVIPGMREKRRGKLINISSVGGMMAMPTMGSYSASKFALEGASEALWYELRPWNIKVVLVEPGFVRSNSFHHVVWSEAALKSFGPVPDDYTSCYTYMSQFIERLMNGALATPESIADKIIKVMHHPDPPLRVAATMDAYFFSLLRRLLPRRMYHALFYRNLPGIKAWGPHA